MKPNYIAGEWLAGASAKPNINPSDIRDVLDEYAHADVLQTEIAIAAARKAFPAWATGPIEARAAALEKI
ncbi:MAG TPA: aldehyde dehydrogenase family protein, partial [Candidatus Dormibacteraeota bacterium]|nr:aldehyde dehydrogenase family protein [Candidatus Dormibacteraeota bacterium]